MEVVATEHETCAAVEGEVAVVERIGRTGFDATAAVVEQAAIVQIQHANLLIPWSSLHGRRCGVF